MQIPSHKRILISPRISEKAVHLGNANKYIFKVDKKANKLEIKQALESFYGIKVASVNVLNVEGKKVRYGRTEGEKSDFKKAIVTLTKDSKKPAFTAE